MGRRRRRTRRLTPKAYLVWGSKIGRRGRQLGSSKTRKSDANKEAKKWKKKGYVANVQPSYRKPKK